MSIKAQVLILPTDHSYGWDKNQLCKCIMERHDHPEYRKGDLMISNHKHTGFTHFWQAQHLYLITNEPIKEGEWYYSITFNRVIQALVDDLNGTPRRDFKIIASTDRSLKLPTIPLTWIRDIYVPSNGTIKEVELEVNYYCKLGDALAACNRNCDCSNETQYLELTPTDEVVILNTPQAKALALTEELLPALQDINHPITKDEFMYQLKHVVPTNERKEWAEQNKHRIIKAPVQTAIKMKKTVQIVTVPINKQGFWNIGDIMKSPSGDRIWLINITNFGETLCFWQAQQLLVLSDDKIQEGDSFYDSFNNLIDTADRTIFNIDSCVTDRTNAQRKKVISSYPQLEGTLPLSKETIQQWIDNGTPKVASVDMLFIGQKLIHNTANQVALITKDDGERVFFDYQHQGKGMYLNIKELLELNPKALRNPKLDSQSNLILEFAEKTYTQHEFLAKLKTVPSDLRKQWAETNKQLIRHVRMIEKTIVPTDVEIEEKAENYKNNSNLWGSGDSEECLTTGYFEGYKQALKDLGYDK